MDLEKAIRLCMSIGECEVGTIRKLAIQRLIEEIQKDNKKVAIVDNNNKT